jgi:hypothetical protein
LIRRLVIPGAGLKASKASHARTRFVDLVTLRRQKDTQVRRENVSLVALTTRDVRHLSASEYRRLQRAEAHGLHRATMSERAFSAIFRAVG